ncbi:MAG: Unknown protein [uncultured Sulfurovum sp.]|uniref:Uncharacterized protein n=1 Tax=uncultured Sulfurovum sp. TaxID=269237 RepID=A0A6S6TBC6_9BACT|nr:MAG: Unknown protein [uncultured Sulfurovum sp.]
MVYLYYKNYKLLLRLNSFLLIIVAIQKILNMKNFNFFDLKIESEGKV